MRRYLALGVIVLAALLLICIVGSFLVGARSPMTGRGESRATSSPGVWPTTIVPRSPDPSPTLPVRPTALTPSPTRAPDPTTVDTDGDMFPDQIEKSLGWDPLVNECAATLGSTLNVLIISGADSGMTGEIPGGKKSELVKEAVRRYIATLPIGVNVGFMSCGQGGTPSGSAKTESCARADLLYPLNPPEASQMEAALATFEPNGWNPLGGCLQEVDKAFAYRQGQTNRIILIADTDETCDGQPCRVAQTLKKSALGMTIDTINLRGDERARTQLQCLANATGGLFYDTPTADDFFKVWNIQRQKADQWSTMVGAAGPQKRNYQECLSKRMREFNTWAQSTGWTQANTSLYTRIILKVTKEMTR